MGTAFCQLSPVLRWAPALTLMLVLGPVLAGLAGVVWPALSAAAWPAFWGQPGLGAALRASLVSGLVSSMLALMLAVLVLAAWAGRPLPNLLARVMAAMVAMPHAAFAIGLAFLLAPSGLLVRLISPGVTGWTRPPDIGLIADGWGLALAVGLALREAPFLLMVLLAALGQIDTAARLRTARALGYAPVTAWLKLVLPALYPQIRLPLFAVLAYGLSTVDMALILGPTVPPTLAVLVMRWSQEADLAFRPIAAVGALVQTGLVVAVLAGWVLAERLVVWAAKGWVVAGARNSGAIGVAIGGYAAAGLLAGMALLAVLALMFWAFAGRWPFPDILPTFSLQTWQHTWPLLPTPAFSTLGLGVLSAGAALLLVLACLENEALQNIRPGPLALWLLYLPLLVPQISFVFGLTVLLSGLGWLGHWLAVGWAHLVFVLPYVFLTLADPYRALDPRLRRAARALGAGAWRSWARVILPLLVRPLLLALAIGFSVSVALYLPTVQIGAGRITTLTTEAVTLAGGGDRRLVAVLAFAQMALPTLALLLAGLLPPMLAGPWRGRVG